MEGETIYTVYEAASILNETPQRVREMLATGELEGIPPGATLSGEWKVLLPTTLGGDQASLVDGPSEDQDEAPPADDLPQSAAAEPEEATGADAPPAASEVTEHPPDEPADEPADEPSGEPLGESDENLRRDVGESGWTTTKQAAKVLGVTRRSVQGYVHRGLLAAREEGEGVNKTFLVSIDSLNALRARRMREAGEAAKFAEPSEAEPQSANLDANVGEALRHAIERIEARTAEATELRVRLQITEKAESTLRAELEEERRRRQAAERGRDELRRLLEARREPPPEARESSVRPAPTETPAGTGGGPQEAREVTQSAAETLRGPEPRPGAGGAQQSPQGTPEAGRRRGRLWRRVFGR